MSAWFFSNAHLFQSTPPVKAATFCVHMSTPFFLFQSTPPVKAATLPLRLTQTTVKFQSTPPVKAATLHSQVTFENFTISIHAAREGGDARFIELILCFDDFNPRRP